MDFFVPCRPVPKGRPRFCRRGKFVQTYTPKTTLACEKEIREAFLNKNSVGFPEGVPVSISVTVGIAVPKSASKTRREQMLSGMVLPIFTRGDVDNYAKTVLDALNGYAYVDDKQVVRLSVTKKYSNTPGFLICIEDFSARFSKFASL